MPILKQGLLRLHQSAVVWSWVMNGLRLGSGLLVLPLLLHKLSNPDFGMYFVLLSLAALVPILDFGFATNIGRAVSYAMGGATELKPFGFAPAENPSGPNQTLLWQLLRAIRRLYGVLALVTLGLLGAFGTIMVAARVQETASPTVTWIAWGITLLAAAWEMYAGWWNVFLRSMDRVTVSARLAALAHAIKVVLSCILLVFDAGLLSVPIATLVSTFLQRSLSRQQVLHHLGQPPGQLANLPVPKLLSALWPNTWRLGLYFLGSYLNTHALILACQTVVGLAVGAQYAFSVQLVFIANGMAQVWTFVKWPVVGQLRIRQDDKALRHLLWPRFWLQFLTFAPLAAALLLLAPVALDLLRSNKSLLPAPWLGLLLLTAFLELHCTFWNTLISTENRLPMVWPTLISNLAGLLLVLVLIKSTHLGLVAFVLSPLAVGSLYNFWKWPGEGARSIGTSWARFLLNKD